MTQNAALSDAVMTQPASQRKRVLEVKGVWKRFGALAVLQDVSLVVHEGEVVALLGDNGAGKSTLVKCISGIHKPERGSIKIREKELSFRHPAEARSMGVETVYQDLALFENLDATANFFAGRELGTPSWLPPGLRIRRDREMLKHSQEVISDLRVRVPDLKRTVSLMSGGQRQSVAVARAAAFAAPLVILDEPTAALGVRESAAVLALIHRLAERGTAVILISHQMDHVMEVAHRAVVLRRGRVVGDVVPTKETHEEIVSYMLSG
ncbi:MAG TPA: ATP-binding cassette domain-containing protein [Solirubrobacteraceae bacterium]|jgi:ABC-type sugar transport system ATPase subunit|nr:ATP-binding cassette domain-containing protein [Solirubrobacteraceae bacterium]